MMPLLTLSGDEPVLFETASLREFKGLRLTGSEYWLAERPGFAAHFQEYYQPDYSLSYRVIKTTDRIPDFSIEEEPGLLRLEAVLEGALFPAHGNGPGTGHYRLTNTGLMRSALPEYTILRYMVARISNYTDPDIGLFKADPFRTFPLSTPMNDLLNGILQSRYHSSLLPFYYDNCVRELFFLHAAQQNIRAGMGLSEQEMAAVYEADRIIRENISEHISIQELARKTGTNEYKLKKDFRTVFGVGLFGRLLQLRMQRAQQLLQTTPLAIKDIAELAGYDTVAGFITAFRKYFGSPPGAWRNRSDSDAGE